MIRRKIKPIWKIVSQNYEISVPFRVVLYLGKLFSFQTKQNFQKKNSKLIFILHTHIHAKIESTFAI